MRQLLVECSDPGLVVALAEEFENVLRHVDFSRAMALGRQLNDLAQDLGPEHVRAWEGFRLEVPNDGGHPLSFGKRETIDEASLKELLSKAEESRLGQFQLRNTLLLPQDGPAPETRKQYVRDLADGIHAGAWEELGIFQMPVDLPASMATHRRQLMDEYGADALKARASYPTVGHLWIQESIKRVEEALREVNTRSESVMEYELARLTPDNMEQVERIRWAALAVRLGKNVEKWVMAAAEPLTYLYRQAALAGLLWSECRGQGPARPFLTKRLESIIEQASAVYTDDGVDGLRLLYNDLLRPPWGDHGDLLAVKTDTDGSEDLKDK